MSARRRGLGRGLDALLPAEPAPEPSAAAGPMRLPIDALKANRFQPRIDFDEENLESLAGSIAEQGIVQPIVVTAADEAGHHTIVAGERRWRASRRAGLREVPVVVRAVSGDQELLELALVENLQRSDLNAIEEAEAFKALADRFGLSQDQIGQRVGRSRPAITNALRLLRLPPAIQDRLRDGRLSAGQAKPLLSLADESAQIELAERAVERGLSARAVETLVAAAQEKPERKAKPKAEPDVHTRAATERLTRALQTRVEIKRRRRGGELRIHFHSEDELIRLYDHLVEAKGDE